MTSQSSIANDVKSMSSAITKKMASLTHFVSETTPSQAKDLLRGLPDPKTHACVLNGDQGLEAILVCYCTVMTLNSPR